MNLLTTLPLNQPSEPSQSLTKARRPMETIFIREEEIMCTEAPRMRTLSSPEQKATTCHKREARFLIPWDSTLSATTRTLVGISFSSTAWVVQPRRHGVGKGIWNIFGLGGWPTRMVCRHTGSSLFMEGQRGPQSHEPLGRRFVRGDELIWRSVVQRAQPQCSCFRNFKMVSFTFRS